MLNRRKPASSVLACMVALTAAFAEIPSTADPNYNRRMSEAEVRDVRFAAFAYLFTRSKAIYGPNLIFDASDGSGYFDTAHVLDSELLRRLDRNYPTVTTTTKTANKNIDPEKIVDVSVIGPDRLDANHMIVSGAVYVNELNGDDTRLLLLVRNHKAWTVSIRNCSTSRREQIRMAIIRYLDTRKLWDEAYLSFADFGTNEREEWTANRSDPSTSVMKQLRVRHYKAGSKMPTNMPSISLTVGPITIVDDHRAMVTLTQSSNNPSMADTDEGAYHESIDEYLVTKLHRGWSIELRGGASGE